CRRAFVASGPTGEATVDRLERVRQLHRRAVFGGDAAALDEAGRELAAIPDGGAVAAEVTLARGRLLHARFLIERVEHPDQRPLLERAAEEFAAIGDRRGEA